MAILIASLAFASLPEYIDSANTRNLIASLILAIVGCLILRLNTKKREYQSDNGLRVRVVERRI